MVLLVGASQGPTLAEPTSWDYVALGDSLATGYGAFIKGYVPRYEAYIETDTGVAVTRTNLGHNKWTSSELLSALHSDPTFRHAIRAGGDRHLGYRRERSQGGPYLLQERNLRWGRQPGLLAG